jgi:hypothetical protein
MREFLLKIVTLLHTLFVLFVVLAPFVNSNYILLLHACSMPFLMLHWFVNDDTCVLTIIERQLRKQIYGEEYEEEDCFTCNLIKPVYNFVDNYKTFSKLIYMFTTIFWLISFGKLFCKFRNGEITNWKQFFII